MSESPSPNQFNNNAQKTGSNTRTGFFSRSSGVKKAQTMRYTLLLGAIAGITFSVALWGYETILLVRSHVAYPWIIFVIGAILSVLACTLAAFLTHLVNRALAGAIFWVLTARLVAELAIIVPLTIAPRLIMFFEPGLQSRLPVYQITASFRTWIGIGSVWLGIFFAILGLLQLTLVESSVPAITTGGRLTAFFIFIPVMILASVLSSNMISEQLRAPLIGMDQSLEFAIDSQGMDVDPILARSMHLNSVNDISDLFNRPHRLFLGKYDEYYTQAYVLIDFQGEWAECNTVNGQPVMCKFAPTP